MTSIKVSYLTVDDLVSRYAEAAETHGHASRRGDHETANEQYSTLATVYAELRRRGPEAQRALLALLEHPEPAVRGWTAAHALEFSPEDGEPALTELVAEGGPIGFNAEMTLEEWRQGNLRFPDP